jgi:hypothetical protein
MKHKFTYEESDGGAWMVYFRGEYAGYWWKNNFQFHIYLTPIPDLPPNVAEITRDAVKLLQVTQRLMK